MEPDDDTLVTFAQIRVLHRDRLDVRQRVRTFIQAVRDARANPDLTPAQFKQAVKAALDEFGDLTTD